MHLGFATADRSAAVERLRNEHGFPRFLKFHPQFPVMGRIFRKRNFRVCFWCNAALAGGDSW